MNLKETLLFSNLYSKSILNEIDIIFYLKCLQHGCLCSVGIILSLYWNIYGIGIMLGCMCSLVGLEIHIHDVFEQNIRPLNIRRSLLNIAEYIKFLRCAKSIDIHNTADLTYTEMPPIHYPSIYHFIEIIAYYEKVQSKETFISTTFGCIGFVISLCSYSRVSWGGQLWICMCLGANLGYIRFMWRSLNHNYHDCHVAYKIERSQLRDIQKQIVFMFHHQEAIHHNNAYYTEFMGLSPLFRNLERIRQSRRKKVHTYIYAWMSIIWTVFFLNISCIFLIPTVYFGFNWFYLLISIYCNIYRYLQYQKNLDIYNHRVRLTLDRYTLAHKKDDWTNSDRHEESVRLTHFPNGTMEMKLFQQTFLLEKNQDVILQTERHRAMMHQNIVDHVYRYSRGHPLVIIDNTSRTMVPGNIGFNVVYGSSYVMDSRNILHVGYREKENYGTVVESVLKQHDLYTIRNRSVYVFGEQASHPVYQNITLARAYLRSLDHAGNKCPTIWVLHLYTRDMSRLEHHLKQIRFLKNFNSAKIIFALPISLDHAREKVVRRYFPDLTRFYID